MKSNRIENEARGRFRHVRRTPLSIGSVLMVGLVAEAAIPFAAILLSDVFFFEVPDWSLWLLFGVVPVLTLGVVSTHLLRAACHRRKPA